VEEVQSKKRSKKKKKKYKAVHENNLALSKSNKGYINRHAVDRALLEEVKQINNAQVKKIADLEHSINSQYYQLAEQRKQYQILSSIHATDTLARIEEEQRAATEVASLKGDLRQADEEISSLYRELSVLREDKADLIAQLRISRTECQFAVGLVEKHCREQAVLQRHNSDLLQRIDDLEWELAGEQAARDQTEDAAVVLEERLQEAEGVPAAQPGDPEAPPVPGQE
jgi:hypothetical protein